MNLDLLVIFRSDPACVMIAMFGCRLKLMIDGFDGVAYSKEIEESYIVKQKS